MNRLRKIVYNKLKNVSNLGDRIYYVQAPQNAELPYVVFNFPSEGRTHREQSEVTLEIAIYDCERGDYNVANQIEQLTDNVDFEFDYVSGETANHSNNCSYWFRKNGRIAVPYPQESNIWRRELRYNVRVYNINGDE